MEIGGETTLKPRQMSDISNDKMKINRNSHRTPGPDPNTDRNSLVTFFKVPAGRLQNVIISLAYMKDTCASHAARKRLQLEAGINNIFSSSNRDSFLSPKKKL